MLVFCPLFLPPRIEVACGSDIRGEARIVKVEEGVFVDNQTPTPHFFFDLRGLSEERIVVFDERVVPVPVALEQGVADEHVSRPLSVHSVVGDEAVTHDSDAVQHGFLVDHGSGAFA